MIAASTWRSEASSSRVPPTLSRSTCSGEEGRFPTQIGPNAHILRWSVGRGIVPEAGSGRSGSVIGCPKSQFRSSSPTVMRGSISQEVLNHVYDVYGYEDFVYSGMPSPALSTKDARWTKQILGALLP